MQTEHTARVHALVPQSNDCWLVLSLPLSSNWNECSSSTRTQNESVQHTSDKWRTELAQCWLIAWHSVTLCAPKAEVQWNRERENADMCWRAMWKALYLKWSKANKKKVLAFLDSKVTQPDKAIKQTNFAERENDCYSSKLKEKN